MIQNLLLDMISPSMSVCPHLNDDVALGVVSLVIYTPSYCVVLLSCGGFLLGFAVLHLVILLACLEILATTRMTQSFQGFVDH